MNKILTWIIVFLLLISGASAYGSIQYNSDFNSYYVKDDTARNWTNALASCEGLGDGWTLARIDSLEEHNYINTLAGGSSQWIGGSNSTDGAWRWTDNRAFYNDSTTLTYSKWGAGSPVGGNGNYLRFYSSGNEWDNKDGTDLLESICENHLDEFYINSSKAIWYLNDSTYNNTFSIYDSFGGYDGIGYGKTFYHGTNNGATQENHTGDMEKFGGYYEFDGTSSNYIDTTAINFSFINNTGITICSDSYKNIDDNTNYLLGVYGSTGHRIFLHGIYQDNSVRTILYNSATDNTDLRGSGGYDTYNYDSWNNVCFTWDKSTTTLTNYLNGNFIKSTITPDNVFYDDNSFRIGYPNAVGWNGSIDEVKIWNRALTQSEIQEEMNANAVANPEGIVAYYSFNDDNGTQVLDQNHLSPGYRQDVYNVDDYAFRWDQATNFDGVDDYVDIGTSITDLIDNNLTVSIWIKPSNYGETYGRYFGVDDGSTDRFFLGYSYTNIEDLQMGLSDWSIAIADFYDSEEWQLITLTLEGTTGKLFKNGIEMYNKTGIVVNIPSKNVHIGRGESNYYFNGSIADVRIYDRALSEDEIEWIYNSFTFQTKINFSDYAIGGTLQVSNNDYAYNYSIDSNQIEINTYDDVYNLSVYIDGDLAVIYEYDVNETAELNLSNIDLNYIYFQDGSSGDPLEDYNITVIYPNNDELELITDSEGKINFTTYRDYIIQEGDYEITFLGSQGYATPITFDLTKSISELPFNQTYNISRANINVSIYDETTSLLITENITLSITGIGSFVTNNGTLLLENVSFTNTTYTIYATSENYSSNQKSFTYTNQEQLDISIFLIPLTYSKLATIYVNAYDSYLDVASGADLRLQKLNPLTSTFEEVAQRTTSSSGSTAFQVLLDENVYRIYGTYEYGGIIYETYSIEEGEVFYADQQIVPIYFNTVLSFTTDRFEDLNIQVYNKTLINNVSYHEVYYYDYAGLDHTVCLEYSYMNGLIKKSSLINCSTSSSGTINYDSGYALNRSYTWIVDVYVQEGDFKRYYYTEKYPQTGSFQDIFSIIIKALIGFSFLALIVVSLYLERIDIFAYLSIFLSLFWLAITPSYLSVTFVGLNIVMSYFILDLSKKKNSSEET